MKSKEAENHWYYHSPTPIRFGVNVLGNIGTFLNEFEARRVAIVGDKALAEIGLIDTVCSYLDGYETGIFADIEPYPSLATMESALRFVRDGGYGAVTGVGGGSAMDVAKAVAVLANKDGELKEYIFDDTLYGKNATKQKRDISTRGVPFVAIPTTAGSGSEVVMWSVIWDLEKKTKHSLSHPLMLASLAIIDPTLTLTAPSGVVASAGIDAFCHGIEAYWSVTANQIATCQALEAMRLIFRNLESSYRTKDIESCTNMCKASLLAGLALGSARTNSAHSMGYSLTQYFGVPHGAASAMFLPALFEFNFDAIGEKGEVLARMTGIKSGREGRDRIRQLMKSLDLPVTLREIGVREDDLPLIVERGYVPFRMANNPRHIDREAVARIVSETY